MSITGVWGSSYKDDIVNLLYIVVIFTVDNLHRAQRIFIQGWYCQLIIHFCCVHCRYPSQESEDLHKRVTLSINYDFLVIFTVDILHRAQRFSMQRWHCQFIAYVFVVFTVDIHHWSQRIYIQRWYCDWFSKVDKRKL